MSGLLPQGSSLVSFLTGELHPSVFFVYVARAFYREGVCGCLSIYLPACSFFLLNTASWLKQCPTPGTPIQSVCIRLPISLHEDRPSEFRLSCREHVCPVNPQRRSFLGKSI